MTDRNEIEITASNETESFTFTAKKVCHRLLIRRQIEVHPRLVPFVRFLFGRMGFNVKVDAIFYHGATLATGCPMAVGFFYSKCEEEYGQPE